MNAYKCDRCGNFFDTKIKSDLALEKRVSINWKLQDLCPICTKSLEQWFETVSKKENNA